MWNFTNLFHERSTFHDPKKNVFHTFIFPKQSIIKCRDLKCLQTGRGGNMTMVKIREELNLELAERDSESRFTSCMKFWENAFKSSAYSPVESLWGEICVSSRCATRKTKSQMLKVQKKIKHLLKPIDYANGRLRRRCFEGTAGLQSCIPNSFYNSKPGQQMRV